MAARWRQAFQSMGGATGIMGGYAIANDLGIIGAGQQLFAGNYQNAQVILMNSFTPGKLLSSLFKWWILPQGIKGVARSFGVRMPWWL